MSGLRQALFSPRSVAIVGQSDDAGKTAGRPLKFLRQMGYAGRVYPINPRRETVLGERAWPSLAALPETPEHVYIVTPTEPAVEAVAECGRARRQGRDRARGRLRRGRARRDWREKTRLREICARTGLRLVGPSSLGIVDLRSKAMLTANAAFDETDLPVGPHLRRLAQRQHDRRAAHARQGARHRLRRAGLGRQRGRPLARRHLRGDAR